MSEANLAIGVIDVLDGGLAELATIITLHLFYVTQFYFSTIL
jgi:hypothetical protein